MTVRYAGIGSRDTPENVLRQMKRIASYLGKAGYTLVTGRAKGADQAFEAGATKVKASVELWVPWCGFEDAPLNAGTPSTAALEMAEKFHPKWDACSQGAKKLHARNCHQILGVKLNKPVAFVVCWTKDGGATGGTGQAMRIATAHGVPIFNLFNHDYSDFKTWKLNIPPRS